MLDPLLKDDDPYYVNYVHIYFCPFYYYSYTDHIPTEACVCGHYNFIVVREINDFRSRLLSQSADLPPGDIEDVVVNLGAIRKREKNYYYKMECHNTTCKTTYKFACKCNAANLLLSGCENCRNPFKFESLERWNKNNSKLVGKTELGLRATFRIVNDVFGQNSSVIMSDGVEMQRPIVKSTSKFCPCPCTCRCRCPWTETPLNKNAKSVI